MVDPARSTPSFHRLFESIVDAVESALRGKRSVIELAVVALLADGHLLVEDVPGVGKTTLAKSLASSIGCASRRVQFTPDLMPSDLTGTSIWNQRDSRFEFHPGPIVTNVLLADEINRASPKTQSALLEAMEERQVTIEGVATPLPRPFLVIATQNPVEHEGTFALPESQLDRFLMRITIGYPDRSTEAELVAGSSARVTEPAVTSEELRAMIDSVSDVHMVEPLVRYLVDLAEASRRHPALRLGMSPRATIQLGRAARALAAGRGRDYVTPDDVKTLAGPVIAHRLVPRADANRTGGTERIVREIVDSVPVPSIR